MARLFAYTSTVAKQYKVVRIHLDFVSACQLTITAALEGEE
jgi:hypothetical protein